MKDSVFSKKSSKSRASTSIIEAKAPTGEILDTWFGGFILVVTMFIHLFCTLYLFLISTFQYMHTPMEAEVLGIIDPIVTVITHYICAALHLKGLFSTICCRTKKIRTETMSNNIVYLGPPNGRKNTETMVSFPKRNFQVISRLFDINGKFFELGIIFLEALEVLAATSQAYLMSKNSPRRIPPFLFSLLVSLNCIITPAIMQSQKRSMRRYLILFVDGIFDFLYSVSFPIYIIVTKAYENYANGNAQTLYNDPYYVTESVFDTRQAFITSRISLFVNLAPFFLTYITFQTLTNMVKKNRGFIKCSLSVQEEIRQSNLRSFVIFNRMLRSISRKKRIIQYCFVGWSTLVFVISLLAINRGQCHEACVLQSYPWFHGECSCIAFNVNCKKMMLTTEEMYKQVSLTSSHLYILEIAQCDLSNGPNLRYIERFKELVWFRLMFNRLDRWQYDKHILPNSLNFFYLLGSNLTHIPVALRQKIPGSLRVLYIHHSLITEVPDDAHLYWKSLYNVGLGHARITKFPTNVLLLPLLLKISFPYNMISEVPNNLNSSSLLHLDLKSNRISSLPANLFRNLSVLNEFRFDGNPINHLPVSFEKYFDKLSKFEISETGLCKRLLKADQNTKLNSLEMKISKNLKAICHTSCSNGCLWYNLGDNFCDLPCNLQKCNWDNGDCTKYAI